MKRSIFTIVFAFVSLFSIGQVSGGFYYGTDYWGNMFVYFQGTNVSQYSVQIDIKSINELLDEEKSWECNLSPGKYFTIGPSDGWYWQSGEKLIITYSNGKSYYWIYAPQQNNNNNFFNPYSIDPAPNTSQQYKICYTCRGVGSCPVCHGTGTYSAYGFSSTCSGCNGNGKCWHCSGSGKQ